MRKVFIASLLAVAACLPAKADGVFETLQANCGKAFEGKMVRGTEDDAWRTAKVVMHVRACSDTEIKVPLHVDDNHSRIWILTKTEDGLRLKHDHRHMDGTPDAVTMYGGDSAAGDGGAGDAEISFPVDAESIAVFKANGLDQSITNVWHMLVKGDKFSYRLTRENRDFMVEFDLSTPAVTPPDAWDMVK